MAVNENSLKNIIPPQPGEVRNPNGKPKGTLAAKTVIRKWFEAKMKADNPVTGQEEELTTLDIAVLKLLNKAMQGDVPAFKELLDRYEGKAPQSLELTGAEGGPIDMTIGAYQALSDEQLLKLLHEQ